MFGNRNCKASQNKNNFTNSNNILAVISIRANISFELVKLLLNK